MTTQFSDGKFTQGLVAAEIGKLSPKLAQYYSDWTKNQNLMVKTSMDAAVMAGWSQFASGMAQAGISAVSAGTSFVSAGSSATALTDMQKAETACNDAIKPINDELKDLNPEAYAKAKSPVANDNSAQIKLTKEGEPPNAVKDNSAASNSERTVKSEEAGAADTTRTPQDKARTKVLERQRQDAIDKKNEARDAARMKSDQSSAMANFFSQAGKAVGEVIDGGARQTTQIAQAQQQVAQNSANNASSAREDAARNYNEMLSGLQALFSYAQALTR